MPLPAKVNPIDAEIWGLEASYLLPLGEDRRRIVSLLKSTPQCVPVLKEAVGVLQSLFGREARLYLHLDRDPDDGFEELFATVRTAHAPELGLQLMAAFDERWWLGRFPYLEGKLNFIWEPLG